MFLMDTLPRMLMFLFMFTAMLCVGLQTTAGDLRSLLESKGLLVRSLLANFVAVPIVGIVLARTLPFKPEAAAALLLLACTPGGLNALQYTTKIKGASLFAGSSAFLLSFMAVFLSPVLLTLVLLGDVYVKVPYARALFYIMVLLLLPLVGGMLVRGRWVRRAEKLSKLSAVVSAVLFVAAYVLIMGLRKEAMHSLGKGALLSMLLFIGISMAVGWFMGGPAKQTRQVLATVTGMRHVSLCLLIALNTFPGPEVQTPLVAFSALMIPPNTLFAVYMVISSRRAARALQK
jgi:bile acid:Na+ symporter, BASS family